MSRAREVLGLCRAVLSGRRGVVVAVKVFLDESGVHDTSPVVTVAAYMARPKQWESFTKAWRLAIRPAKVYHATDAANLRGEFRGWSTAQVAATCARALPIINQNVMVGIAAGIQMNDFREALKDRPDLLRIFGSPYGACLHWVMRTLLDRKVRSGNREIISFFHEQNSFAQEALNTFSHMKDTYGQSCGSMTFAFGSKEDFIPLQAADILAYEANKRIRAHDTPNRRPLDVLGANDGRLLIMSYDQRNLPSLVDVLERVVTGSDGAGV